MIKDQLQQYVSGLDLAAPSSAYPVNKSVVKKPDSDQEQSFLNARSLVSFASGVTGSNKQHILDSTLFAQLAANKQFPEEGQSIEWYQCFISVMSKLGWIVEDGEISVFDASKGLVEVENVIIDVLTSALGGTYITVITKTLGALKSLSKQDGKIKAFERNTHTQTQGAFQVGLALEENNTVSLNLSTFLLKTTEEIRTILFFKSSKESVHLEYCVRKATLNVEVYEGVSKMISSKLNEMTGQFIAEIDI